MANDDEGVTFYSRPGYPTGYGRVADNGPAHTCCDGTPELTHSAACTQPDDGATRG